VSKNRSAFVAAGRIASTGVASVCGWSSSTLITGVEAASEVDGVKAGVAFVREGEGSVDVVTSALCKSVTLVGEVRSGRLEKVAPLTSEAGPTAGGLPTELKKERSSRVSRKLLFTQNQRMDFRVW
jgi:hypothetical protein